MDRIEGEERSATPSEQGRPPVIIAPIGTRDYELVANRMTDGREVRCRFIQIALAELFGASRLCLLATHEAEAKQKLLIEQEAREHGLDLSIEWHRIPAGATAEEQWETFWTLVKVAEHVSDAPIIMDITHGYRSIPLLVLLGITFLQTVRRVDVRGIYYGAFEARVQPQGGQADDLRVSPIIDLSEALYLQKWLEAARDFMRYGDARGVAQLLGDIHRTARTSDQLGMTPTRLKNLANRLSDMSASIMFGRVNDLPTVANRLREFTDGKIAEQVDREAIRAAAPLKLLMAPMCEAYFDMATGNRFEDGCALVKWHVDHKNYVVAVQVMRELMVTKVGKVGFPDTDDSKLFDSKWRQDNPERILGHLCQRLRMKARLGETAARLAAVWGKVSELRNDLSHCGMRGSPIPVDRLETGVPSAFADFRELMLNWPEETWRDAISPCLVETGGETARAFEDQRQGSRTGDGSCLGCGAENVTGEKHRVLITPVGLSSGLLYTALMRVEPSKAVVVCSDASKAGARGAAETAGFAGELEFVGMDEPFTGFGEAAKVFGEVEAFFEREGLSPDRDEVWINLTGGTTAMQHVVNYVGQRLKRRGYAVRYVAMVDRRPHEQQMKDPFVVGEMILCPEGGADDEGL